MSYRTLNAIDELPANFSRKVWQKISILESFDPAAIHGGMADCTA
jgi:hypothetical protein